MSLPSHPSAGISNRLESGFHADHEWILDYETGVGYLRAPLKEDLTNWFTAIDLLHHTGWTIDSPDDFCVMVTGADYLRLTWSGLHD